MVKHEKGFTLIELVVVLVILGVLAAVSLPRFMNLDREARMAQLRAMEGSMNAVSELVYGKAKVATPAINLGAANQLLTVNSDGITTVQVNFGYPNGTAAGIDSVLDFSASDWTVATVAGTRQYQWRNYANCYVRYAAAAAVGGVPTITVNNAGC